MTGPRRFVGAWVAVLVLAAGCGSGAETSLGAGLGHLIGEASEDMAPSVATTTAPPTTTAPATTTTTTAVDPYETLVATVKPEVGFLHTFDRPHGELQHWEYPLVNPTYFDNELVLMVTDDGDEDGWLEVQLPVRPNGTTAWIRAADVTLSTLRFRAEVDVTERSVTVWDGRELVVETGAVVGKDRSPTPVGSFYINELITKWEGSAYGPYILGLSAFSEALDTFNGGVPVIAIHGTNRPELIGGAHSNGCIRIPNEVVTLLAETVPMGTPVEIVA